MIVESIILLGLIVLGVSMYLRHRRENPPVDMNHQAPNVHNVQMEGKVGPATAAEKPAPAKKKAVKKKAAPKAVAAAAPKKTTKKKATTKK
jgi:hypothetical protein